MGQTTDAERARARYEPTVRRTSSNESHRSPPGTRRPTAWTVVLALASLASLGACGGDAATDTSCGGVLSGTWRFDAVRFETGEACSADAPAVSGTLTFNDNGRYSLVLDTRAWAYGAGAACGVDKAHGGWWRTEGANVCFAMAQDQLGACDESAYRPELPENAAGTYCVKDGVLSLRSRTFAGLTNTAVLRLVR